MPPPHTLLIPTSSNIPLKSEDFLEEEVEKISDAIHKNTTTCHSRSLWICCTKNTAILSTSRLTTTWGSCATKKKIVVFSINIGGLAPAFLQETLLLKHHPTYQDQASVHQGEGSWASYPSAAVHHRGSVLGAQRTRLPNLEEEFEEGGRRLRHTKIGPCGVMKMEDLPGLPRL